MSRQDLQKEVTPKIPFRRKTEPIMLGKMYSRLCLRPISNKLEADSNLLIIGVIQRLNDIKLVFAMI